MFFILSKLLIYLIKPFLVLSLLLIFSFIIKSKTWKRTLRIFVLLGFLVTTNGVLIGEILLKWEIPAVRIADLPDDYEVGIVLGGGADIDREPDDRIFLNRAGDRIIHAVHLYRAGKIKKILYTGASPRLFEDVETSNKAILNFYLDCGIPLEDVIIENESKNTYENAVLSAPLLSRDSRHLLITSAFHMRRSFACFRKAGISVEPFSCNFYSPKEEDRFSFEQFIPSADAMEKWEILLKEWIGIAAYKFNGYI